VAVLTGDIQTENDAKRLARYGYPVQQIATGGACHLDAKRIQTALSAWRLDDIDLLFIENVGNLICPSSYDLGEEVRVVLFSVTEGEDKPLKYPATFAKADLVLLTKTDLVPHLTMDPDLAKQHVLSVRPEATILDVSATADNGLASWLDWLAARRVGRQSPRIRRSNSSN
jgi:hydrogenase nickel incorporation protein HypB